MSTFRVCAQIDLDAFAHNVEAIKKKSPAAKLMGVVKANAYGHGAVVLSRELEQMGANALAVACVDEGVELRQAGISLPILVLGFTPQEQYGALLDYDIRPTVFSYEAAKAMDEAARARGVTLPIHIKLDTGMGRIGFLCNEESVEEILRIGSLSNLFIEGMFTHFACADMEDESSKALTQKQFEAYMWMEQKLACAGLNIPVHHCANSAGIMEDPHMQRDMVRAGIILYGLYPSEEMDRENISLYPVMSLKSQVSHVKTLPQGMGVSYGHTYVTDKETVVATIPVGYGDGYPRLLSGKGHVLIHGHRVPIIGRVCMDQFMVDVTGLDLVRPGDEVILVGQQGDSAVTFDELAALTGTIHYELVCNMGRRIPRVYMKGGKITQIVEYL